jgi:hypothetical protein
MKRVLKDLNTGLFFKNMDQWTAHIEEAANFRDTLSALKFCEKNNLTGVAVVLFAKDGAPARILGFRRNSLLSNQPSTSLDRRLALSDENIPEQ